VRGKLTTAGVGTGFGEGEGEGLKGAYAAVGVDGVGCQGTAPTALELVLCTLLRWVGRCKSY
jgi:hypothetical protein